MATTLNDVQLRPLDSPELIQCAAGWMAEKQNYQWLDCGDGKEVLTVPWLKILTQRQNLVLRAYTARDFSEPIGLVALDDINPDFRTGRIWIVAGVKSFRARGYATAAASRLLTSAFREFGLRAVNTWIVDGNPSIRIAERLNFKFIGRQRECHYIDGRPYDRLWFDILASEHLEIA